MQPLTLVFYLLLFFTAFMVLIGLDKRANKENSMEVEKGRVILIVASIFGFIDILIGYKVFF